MTILRMPDHSVSPPENPSTLHIVKRSLAIIVVGHTIRLSLAVVLMLSLCSCPLFERINELITDSKGSRPIGFLVIEPIKYELGDDNEFKTQIGFDTETAGMEKTLKSGIKVAAGRRIWNALWIGDRAFLKDLYTGIFAVNSQGKDVKGLFRDILSLLRKQENTRSCEALICSVIGSVPSNPGFNKVYAFCYDIAEDKMIYLVRPIPRDQGSIKFQEEMGNLITDLCEKLYGNDSR